VLPIYRDVKYGSGGRCQGKFVMSDGESRPVYNKALLQDPSRLPLLQENGKRIYLEDANE
jgi:hypothetical protein